MPTIASPLDGRVALVTGANHGIGAAIAVALAARGADVAIAHYRPFAVDSPGQSAAYVEQRSGDGTDVAAAIVACGRRCLLVEADLADTATPAMLFDRAERELGPVAVLVHNASGWRQDTFAHPAGGNGPRPGAPVTAASIDAQFHVDARAGALLMQQFIDRHRARGDAWGRIVAMTSGGRDGFPGEVSYGAAKSALVSFALSAASEMAADGVTVNVVHPPVTDTGWITDEVRAFVAADHELHHIARPDEVAATVAWLCADANHLVTGNVLRLR